MNKSLDKITIKSPISVDNGFTNEYKGDFESTFELFESDEPNHTYFVEWDIPELEETVGVGIFCYEKDKVISDYDGVFEIPPQMVEFLEKNGFDCTYLKD